MMDHVLVAAQTGFAIRARLHLVRGVATRAVLMFLHCVHEHLRDLLVASSTGRRSSDPFRAMRSVAGGAAVLDASMRTFGRTGVTARASRAGTHVTSVRLMALGAVLMTLRRRGTLVFMTGGARRRVLRWMMRRVFVAARAVGVTDGLGRSLRLVDVTVRALRRVHRRRRKRVRAMAAIAADVAGMETL